MSKNLKYDNNTSLEHINKETNYKKDSNRNSKVENYNKWNEKNHQRASTTDVSRQNNQQTWIG